MWHLRGNVKSVDTIRFWSQKDLAGGSLIHLLSTCTTLEKWPLFLHVEFACSEKGALILPSYTIGGRFQPGAPIHRWRPQLFGWIVPSLHLFCFVPGTATSQGWGMERQFRTTMPGANQPALLNRPITSREGARVSHRSCPGTDI